VNVLEREAIDEEKSESSRILARNRALEEYKLLQSHLITYRSASMTIKNWSVTVCLAGLAAGFSQGKPAIFLLAALAAVTFWIMDARWLVYGESFNSRAVQLENFFASNKPHEYSGPLIEMTCSEHRKTMRNKPHTLKLMLRRSIHMPYSIILSISALVFMLSKLNFI